jgi:hypothetical protein
VVAIGVVGPILLGGLELVGLEEGGSGLFSVREGVFLGRVEFLHEVVDEFHLVGLPAGLQECVVHGLSDAGEAFGVLFSAEGFSHVSLKLKL